MPTTKAPSIEVAEFAEDSLAYEIGYALGLAIGVHRGRRELLAHLISVRFPEHAPSLDALLEGASTADIDAIAEALLHASSAEQLRDLMIARLRDRGD